MMNYSYPFGHYLHMLQYVYLRTVLIQCTMYNLRMKKMYQHNHHSLFSSNILNYLLPRDQIHFLQIDSPHKYLKYWQSYVP
jgi:hypothetical protein